MTLIPVSYTHLDVYKRQILYVQKGSVVRIHLTLIDNLNTGCFVVETYIVAYSSNSVLNSLEKNLLLLHIILNKAGTIMLIVN